jgi:hypothetical protein
MRAVRPTFFATLVAATLGAGCYSVRAIRPESVVALGDGSPRRLESLDGTTVTVERRDTLVLKHGPKSEKVPASAASFRTATSELLVTSPAGRTRAIPVADLTRVVLHRSKRVRIHRDVWMAGGMVVWLASCVAFGYVFCRGEATDCQF